MPQSGSLQEVFVNGQIPKYKEFKRVSATTDGFLMVQEHSLVKYEVRAPKVSQMKELFERVVKVAQGPPWSLKDQKCKNDGWLCK